MNDDYNLREYASIKSQIKVLEEKLEELKSYVIDEIQSNGSYGKNLETPFGTFVLMERKTYEYPEALVQEEKDLKLKKKQYEASNEAVLKSAVAYPVFYEPKEI